ncbi:hypothetical protein Q4I28_002992 [Leishmania naiffi]|uniref:Basal body component n=1 Tax=Leishmania naiffi TaxID=5678 RepID=A0AAW3BUB5_9TRYP
MNTATNAARTLSSDLLSRLQHDYPTVHEALHVYRKAVRHLKDKYEAKETELRRCINVGEELLGQMDVLKQRCEVLAQERDKAIATLGLAAASTVEHTHPTGATASSSSSWAEEKRTLLRSHEVECERYRTGMQKVLQGTAAAQSRQRELELALERTTAQLRETEKQLRTAQDTVADCEARCATQHEKEIERHRAALARQLAEVRQQADVDRETVLAEAMVELERLQRALVRTQKDLVELQQASGDAQALQAELASTAAAEQASLQRRIRTLEEANHDLLQRLQRREAETQLLRAESSASARRDDSQRSPASVHGGVGVCDSALANSLVDPRRESMNNDVAGAASLAAVQVRLREENARLRQKLQEVARRGQDEVDEEHAARLSLQQHLHTVEAQSHILRTEVVGRIQQELQQARDQVEVSQAHGATVQRAAAELEVQTAALQEEKTTLTDALRAEKETTERLWQELKAAQERQDALNQELQGASVAAQEKDQLVAQLQREKSQLLTALRTFQAQAVDIETALTTVTAEQSESTATHEATVSRLQNRCVLLAHEAEELRTERAALRCRLGDAEEAVDALKDAQRVSQALVREAQRGAKAAEDRASFAANQLTLQRQNSAARLAEVQQHLERAHTQQRDLSRRMEECQQELSRKEEALRKRAEAQEVLVAEIEQLRADQANRDENLRERWRQQYAQSSLERERLIAIKEAHIADLQRQQQELQMSLAENEGRVAQLQGQRQQLQAALSDSLATAASHKGRIQALEEELACTGEAHRTAQRELQRVAGERKRDSSATTALQPSGERDASAAARLAQLQVQLAECEAALCAAERSRQLVQCTVLGCLIPMDTSGAVKADTDKVWDTLLDLLSHSEQELRSRSTFAMQAQAWQVSQNEVSPVSDDKQTGDAATLPIDAIQRAAPGVLRATNNLLRHLHDADLHRWNCVINKVMAALAVTEAASEETSSAGAGPPPIEGPAAASSEKLCADLASALRMWAQALRQTHDHLAEHAAQAAKAAHLASTEAAQRTQLRQLTLATRTAEEQCGALQVALEEMTAKYSEVVKRTEAQESRAEALRHDIAARDICVREMEHRLDVCQAEMQAERAEWVSKWQEAQRHREAEKKEAEAEHARLRAQVMATEEAAHRSTQRAVQESASAQQQLHTQLQALLESSSAMEVQLRQQVTQLSRGKEDSERGLRQLKSVVAQLEERLSSTEETLRSRETELKIAVASMQELKQTQLQRRADGAAANAFEQRTLTEQVASLQAQLLSSQRDHEMQEALHAAERAEMAALRKVNTSLETRLAEVEGDRAPLREQLHSLLSFTE